MSEKKGSGKWSVTPKAPKSASSVEYDAAIAGEDVAEPAQGFDIFELKTSLRKLKEGSVRTLECLSQTSEFESSLTTTIEEAELAAQKADEMKKENDDLANSVERLEKEIAALRDRNTKLERDATELELKLKEKDDQIYAANREINECKSAIESWERKYGELNQYWKTSWEMAHQRKQHVVENMRPIETETTRELLSLEKLMEAIQKIPTTETGNTAIPVKVTEYKPLEIPKILLDYERPPKHQDSCIDRYNKLMASLEESRRKYQESINQFQEFTHTLNEKYEHVNESIRKSIDSNHDHSQNFLQLDHKLDELIDQMDASIEDAQELDLWRVHRFCLPSSCPPPLNRRKVHEGNELRERLMHVRSQVVGMLRDAQTPK